MRKHEGRVGTRRENQSITVAYKPIYAFSVSVASIFKELQ